MELEELVPDRSENWVIRGNTLMFKKYFLIPVLYIDNDIVYIYLDNRIRKEMVRLVKSLIKNGFEFYCLPPTLSDPSGIENIESEIIKHYLFCHSQAFFFYGFKNIGFDLIGNMVKWSIKNDASHLIRECLDEILKVVNSMNNDWYAGVSWYVYADEIRDEFSTLYRHIQISKLLN